MITNINDFKNSINENNSDFKFNAGDMVYVNPFGPMTYGYNGMESDKPFAPKLYDFSINTQYELIHLSNVAGIFDDNNVYQEIDIHNISETPFTDPNINESNINEAKSQDHFIILKGDDVVFSTTDLKEAKDKFKSYPKPTRPSQEVSLYKLIAETKII